MAKTDELFICSCGNEEWVDYRGIGKKQFCKECTAKRELVYRKKYYKAKQERRRKSTRPLCTCGCGRPRGKGLRFLSNKCFRKNYEPGKSLPI